MFFFTPKVLPAADAVLTFLTLDAALGGAVLFAAEGGFEEAADVSMMFVVIPDPTRFTTSTRSSASSSAFATAGAGLKSLRVDGRMPNAAPRSQIRT